ncbi:MAG: hypothetical protein COB53_08650 [Elusimicrobia bacterium]|nr:MAG: hypothetical protein COB53_08650 [Elusimicrobiota bacterium]
MITNTRLDGILGPVTLSLMGMSIGIGLSRLADGFEAARAAARDAKAAVPEPMLAIVFGSIHFDHARVHEGILAEIDAAVVIGGSSYAEVSNAGVTKNSVVILLVSFDGASVRFVDAALTENAERTGEALARGLCDELPAGSQNGATFPIGIFIGSFGDGRENEVLSALRSLKPGMPIFGGLSGADYDLGMSHPDFWKSYQYMGGGVGKAGIRLAVIDLPIDAYRVGFGFEHGWDPVGPEVEFTKTESEQVFEVDGVPIFDYYRQFLGEQESRDFYELMIQRYGFAMQVGGENGRSVLKLPVKCDFDKKAITLFPAEDFAGKKVRLIQSSRQGLLAGARKAAESAMKALDGRTPHLVFMVSCCTRCAILHSRVDLEVEAAREVFGPDVPIFGYYSGGEIFPFLSQVEDIIDASKELSGSHYHTTTVGFLALAADTPSRAVVVPERLNGATDNPDEFARLKRLLAESEDILDSSERFLSNMSRKSYRDGEKLLEQNEQLALKNEHNEKLQGVVHRYTPHDIWSQLGENVAKGVYELADADGVFTFMFLDVKGFTAYSEKHTAAEVVAAINRIFKPATDMIYQCGGDVDKYIGDCIFAAFPNAAAGVKAACGIMKLFETLEGDNPFSIRIGVNSGRAVRANVGSDARREYTYIGDAVNLTQRLEANCTPGKLLLSEGVHDECGASFASAQRKEITVKGKSEPIAVYECTL